MILDKFFDWCDERDGPIKYKELYIFGLQAGKDGHNTLKFCDGLLDVNLQPNESADESVLIFTYTSQSTGDTRVAKFFIDKISGYSYTLKDDNEG